MSNKRNESTSAESRGEGSSGHVWRRRAMDMFGGEEQWAYLEKSSGHVWRRGVVDMFGGEEQWTCLEEKKGGEDEQWKYS